MSLNILNDDCLRYIVKFVPCKGSGKENEFYISSKKIYKMYKCSCVIYKDLIGCNIHDHEFIKDAINTLNNHYKKIKKNKINCIEPIYFKSIEACKIAKEYCCEFGIVCQSYKKKMFYVC